MFEIKPIGQASLHYSDEQLKELKQEQAKEILGLLGCSLFMTLIFWGLMTIL